MSLLCSNITIIPLSIIDLKREKVNKGCVITADAKTRKPGTRVSRGPGAGYRVIMWSGGTLERGNLYRRAVNSNIRKYTERSNPVLRSCDCRGLKIGPGPGAAGQADRWTVNYPSFLVTGSRYSFLITSRY